MTGMYSLLARTLLGCLGAAVTILVSYIRPASTWTSQQFRRAYLVAFAGVRLLLFLLVFQVLHLSPRGDLPGIYIPEIAAHLAGRVPYRNYASSYAPLFPYLFAPLYRLAPSPLTLILFSIAAEVLMAFVFLRLMPRVLTERQARLAALLCLASPISLQFVTVDGQNNVFIGLALGLALLFLTKERTTPSEALDGDSESASSSGRLDSPSGAPSDILSRASSGVALGFAITAIKFLPLLFTPVFPLSLRKRAFPWIAGCAATVLPVYGYFALVLHAPVLQAAEREGGIKSAGGLPFLLESLAGRDGGRTGWDLLLFLGLAGVLWTGWRALRPTLAGSRQALAASAFLLPALLLTVMALGKKTWPTYTEMVLFPLAMAVAAAADRNAGRRRHGPAWMLAAFSLLSVTTHSVWASALDQASAMQVHALLRSGSGTAWLFLSLESLLFVTYAALVVLCLAQARYSAAARA